MNSRASPLNSVHFSVVQSFIEGFSSLSPEERKEMDLPSWRIFYVDERMVPLTDADSNHHAWEELYSSVSLLLQ